MDITNSLNILQSNLTDLIYLARELPKTKKKKESILINQIKTTCSSIGKFYDSDIIDNLDLEEELLEFNWDYHKLIRERKYIEAEKLAQNFASLFVRQKQKRTKYFLNIM